MADLTGIGFALLATAQAYASVGKLPAMPQAPLILSYPQQCQDAAKPVENVSLKFDVARRGTPENIKIVKSTNTCFNEAALKAISNWRFWPDANSTNSGGIDVTLTFDKQKIIAEAEQEIRKSVRKKLDRVRRMLADDGDPEEALERLDKIEDRYGDSYTLAELTAHRMLRAAAHVDAGDYQSALNDLRSADDTGIMDVVENNTLSNAIAIIEAILAEDAKSDK